MKIDWNRRSTTRAAYALIVVVTGLLVYGWISHFNAVNAAVADVLKPLRPIALGLFFAYLLMPVLRRVESFFNKHWKAYRGFRHRRAVSMVVTYLLVLLVISLFLLIVMPQVAKSVAQLTLQIRTYVSGAEGWVNTLIEHLPRELIPEDIASQLTNMAGTIVTRVFSFLNASLPKLFNSVMGVGTGVINFFIAVVVSIYILSDKERIGAQCKRVLYALFSRPRAENCLELVRTADRMFGSFLTGKIVDSLIIGVLCFIGMSLLRFPNAVLVSFIVGVTNVIPYFGPFIGAVPSFFLIAIVSPVQGLLFLVFILVLQQIDGNVIGPKILGNTTGLSSFWVMVAILFFGGIWGVLGMVIGVPLMGVICWWARIALNDRLAAKGLPLDTENYIGPDKPNV